MISFGTARHKRGRVATAAISQGQHAIQIMRDSRRACPRTDDRKTDSRTYRADRLEPQRREDRRPANSVKAARLRLQIQCPSRRDAQSPLPLLRHLIAKRCYQIAWALGFLRVFPSIQKPSVSTVMRAAGIPRSLWLSFSITRRAAIAPIAGASWQTPQ